jgi:4-carboxymuconolactone decarboxylase
MQVIPASHGATQEISAADIFTGGQVWRRALAGNELEGGDFSLSIVQFAAGARTKLHTHSSDQLLYVVAGIGKVGGHDHEHVIAAGDFVRIPAHEEHWHGAGDTGSPMSHIAITLAGAQTGLSG